MDFCPMCHIASDPKQVADKLVFQCRNPQCELYGKVVGEQEAEDEKA